MRTTKIKILHSAETLFADKGFSHTSLREITASANVNLASVNYHFGSKKLLMQGVMRHHLDAFLPALRLAMDDMEQQKNVTIERILESLVEAIFTLEKRYEGGTGRFLKLLSKAYAETQGHLRRFFLQEYQQDVSRFIALIHAALPHLNDEQLFWRLHFSMGTFVFSLSSSQALSEIAEADYHSNIDARGIVKHLMPFLVAGLRQKTNN